MLIRLTPEYELVSLHVETVPGPYGRIVGLQGQQNGEHCYGRREVFDGKLGPSVLAASINMII